MAHGDVAPGASPSKPESHSERVQLLPFSHLEMQSPRLPRSYLPARSPWPAPSFHPPRRPDSRPQSRIRGGCQPYCIDGHTHVCASRTHARTRMHAPHVGHARAYRVHTGVGTCSLHIHAGTYKPPCIQMHVHTCACTRRCTLMHTSRMGMGTRPHAHTRACTHIHIMYTRVRTQTHRAVSGGFPR